MTSDKGKNHKARSKAKKRTAKGATPAGSPKSATRHPVVFRRRSFSALVHRTALLNMAANASKADVAGAMAEAASGVVPESLPGIFLCKAGDTLQCRYQVDGVIVAELDFFWGPDENGDTVPDRFQRLGPRAGNSVDGLIETIPLGYSYLAWSFSPGNVQPWSAQLAIQVNNGVESVYSEPSDTEGEYHQAGLLILAEPQ